MIEQITKIVGIVCFLFLISGCTGGNGKATELASALEKYYKVHERYPETLEELVPTFLPELPWGVCDHYEPSKCTYMYWWGDGSISPDLVYVYQPPFGRATYRFGKGDWNDLG